MSTKTGKKWLSTKVGTKLLSDLFVFSILSFDIQLDFHNSIQVVALKYLMDLLAGINTEQFLKYF